MTKKEKFLECNIKLTNLDDRNFVQKIKDNCEEVTIVSDNYYNEQEGSLEESIKSAYNSNKALTLEKDEFTHDTFMVTTHDWLEIRKIIFSEIQNFFLQNIDSLDQFYEILQEKTLKNLHDNTNLLENLTEVQISYIPKYIIAIYLILIKSDSNNLNMAEIQRTTGLSHHQTDLIREHFNIYPVTKRIIYKYLSLEKSEALVRFLTILLGDGNLFDSKAGWGFTITLNRIDEPEYVIFAISLIVTLFKKKPTRYPKKIGKGINIILYGKELVDEIKSFGLKAGNKTINQVSIPPWFNEKESYRLACLDELINTDGSIYVSKQNKSIIINFTNGSKPLVQDFIDLCSIFEIDTTDIYEDNRDDSIRYYVRINKKDHVLKFLDTVKPKKFAYRKKYLGIWLIILNSIHYKDLEIEIETYKIQNNLKQLLFTKDFEKFLAELCNQFKINIQDSEIEIAINISFLYKVRHYSLESSELYFNLFKLLGNLTSINLFLKLNGYYAPKPDTIKLQLEKYCIENKCKDFNNWYDKNFIKSTIFIQQISGKYTVVKFPKDLRITVSKLIYDIVLHNISISFDEIIDILKTKYQEDSLFRVFFLFKNDEYKHAIIDYLFVIFSVIKKIIQLKSFNAEINLSQLEMEYGLNRRYIREIITRIH